MIGVCERCVGYVGDEWGDSLLIVEGMSVAEVLVLFVSMLA